MPEYLAPGVYIVEVTQGARPIDGVSTSTARLLGLNVVREVQRLTDQLHPGKKSPDKDMTIALVELLAWLADALARRLDQIESEAWLPTASLAAAALALTARTHRGPEHGPVKRVSYFEGQLLDAGDLRGEADYPRDKCRPKFAPGIVHGLDVGVDGDSGAITVSPGYAIDNRGHGIGLEKPLTLTSSLAGACIHVVMRPGRHRPPVALKAMPGWFLTVEKPERDDLVLETLERTSCGWRVAHAAPK